MRKIYAQKTAKQMQKILTTRFFFDLNLNKLKKYCIVHFKVIKYNDVIFLYILQILFYDYYLYTRPFQIMHL